MLICRQNVAIDLTHSTNQKHSKWRCQHEHHLILITAAVAAEEEETIATHSRARRMAPLLSSSASPLPQNCISYAERQN